jgi:hypothetical protein
MTLLSQGPFGAYTPTAAAAIAAALAEGGFGTTGNVYYCDPVNGLDTNDGQTPSGLPLSGGHGPVQTLQAGYNLLGNGFNDVLVLIGNGQASGSARLAKGFTWSKNAAHLVGVCAPSAVSQRARIAPLTGAAQAAFANFFTVSGNGCLFSNLSWFHGFTVGIAAAICMTITGSRNAFLNCDFEGMGDAASATDAGSRSILISGGGQENYFLHCNIGLDTVERTNANASVELQNGSARNIFENCTFLFWSSDGLQYGLLIATAASLDRFILFKGCNFIAGVGTEIAAIFHAVAGAGGLICFDATSGVFNVTALGDATTLGQTWASGGTATTGAKGIVQ